MVVQPILVPMVLRTFDREVITFITVYYPPSRNIRSDCKKYNFVLNYYYLQSSAGNSAESQYNNYGYIIVMITLDRRVVKSEKMRLKNV